LEHIPFHFLYKLTSNTVHHFYTSNGGSLHALPCIIMVTESRMGWAGHVTCSGEMRNAYTILVRSPEGKSPLRRLRSRWEVL